MSPAKTPTAPKHLSREAKGWWSKILEEYDLPRESLLILESALEAFDRARNAQKYIAEHGEVVTSSQGLPHLNPACKLENDAKRTMLSCFRQLGLDLEPLHDKPGRPAGK